MSNSIQLVDSLCTDLLTQQDAVFYDFAYKISNALANLNTNRELHFMTSRYVTEGLSPRTNTARIYFLAEFGPTNVPVYLSEENHIIYIYINKPTRTIYWARTDYNHDPIIARGAKRFPQVLERYESATKRTEIKLETAEGFLSLEAVLQFIYTIMKNRVKAESLVKTLSNKSLSKAKKLINDNNAWLALQTKPNK